MTSISILSVFPFALAVAFLLGFGARMVGLPPLVGFLVAGFVLNAIGIEGDAVIEKVGDFGVMLLLFAIGLKLKVKDLARAEVWAGATLQMSITMLVFSVIFYGLALAGLSLFAGLSLTTAILVAFAGSFSSTVFAVKVLEEKGESSSLHGRAAIGILIMQDIFAVIFLTASTGKIPSLWALALAGLYFARPVLGYFLDRVGHGELLPLFGLFAAVTLGAGLFDLVNLKPDLGALLMGMLLANHTRAGDVADTLFSFKELLLIGFFLSIGLAAIPNLSHIGLALLLMLFVPFKVALFFWLLTRFRLRARSSLLAAFSLANYSEFGLIVTTIGVSSGWLANDWLIVMAIALSISFVVAAPLNTAANKIYARWHDALCRFETVERHPDDQPLDTGDNTIAIFGMGRVGTGAYEYIVDNFGKVVIGIDSDPELVTAHQAEGRNVIKGDAKDSDFWERLPKLREQRVKLAILAMSTHRANMYAVEQMKAGGFEGLIAAQAEYDDHADALREAGAHLAVNLYADAGVGFVTEIERNLKPLNEV
jgi:glutathione-regulated potassium-efflux system ancillary protein KefC